MRSFPIRLPPNDRPQGRRHPLVPGGGVGRGHELEALQEGLDQQIMVAFPILSG